MMRMNESQLPNNMEDCHKYNVEKKKPATEVSTQCNQSIYRSIRNKLTNHGEVRMEVTFLRGQGQRGNTWGLLARGEVLFLSLAAGHM